MERLSWILPSNTLTSPTAHGDAGDELAVSKSIATKSNATGQLWGK
jgi:hypothetical protein